MDASSSSSHESGPRETARPSFAEALRVWLRVGFISFGGPAGQIALLHREVVEKRRWIDEKRFASALSFCTFLPGPEAQQLATYIGWSLHGVRGGLASGILFFLPAAILLLGLSWLRAAHGDLVVVAGVLYGLRPVVAAIVVDAVLGMVAKRLTSGARRAVALLAFLLALALRVPFPWIIAVAGLAGAALPVFRPVSGTRTEARPPFAWKTEAIHVARVLFTGVVLGVLPWVALGFIGGSASFFREVYAFFIKAAFVTFGGAYAVLTYVSTAAVSEFHWLSRVEMMDGLALAETTPGPLIIVLEYVGFMAGWNAPGEWSRAGAGALGALLATYATFLPSLALVILGAPYVERITSIPRLGGGLAAIVAAATGAIASLGIDFSVAVLLPRGAAGGLDPMAFLILAAAFVGLRRGLSLGVVLSFGALLGVLHSLIAR